MIVNVAFQFATGVSFLRSQIRMSEISDGASNTYLVGEKNVCRQFYATLGDLGYDQSCFSGVDLDLNRWSHFAPRPDSVLAERDSDDDRRFGSSRSGIFMMSFCDGSVRPVSYDIDPTNHRRLSNRKDGLKVEPPQ